MLRIKISKKCIDNCENNSVIYRVIIDKLSTLNILSNIIFLKYFQYRIRTADELFLYNVLLSIIRC